ncbi:MAG: hypothetical protein KIH63_005830 [Candidatus Saccharibacteria bacterium]|nr:hypothetical protein [Candidatus Saccharibacteria bacterium]
MNNKRMYFVMIGIVVILAVLNFGAVFGASQMLASKSGKLSDLKLESAVLDEQQASLSRSKRDVENYSELEKIANTVVPKDKDQAAAVREIVKIAEQHGIKFASISFPASTLGQTQAPAATSSGSEGSSTTPSTPKTPVTQVQPVEGITGVYSLLITVQQDTTSPTSYDNFIGFLHDLEQNRRTAQVSTVTVQPNPGDRDLLTFNLTLNAYIKP